MRLASAKWKEAIGKPDKINELILKTKADLKENSDNIIFILGLCFLLINWLSFGERTRGPRGGRGMICLKLLDVQGTWRDKGVRGGGWWGLENWTILMDVICVSSLNKKRKYF